MGDNTETENVNGVTGKKYFIRVAQKEDYEAVLDINRHVYDGYDYLPGKYMQYVEHKNNLPLVCEDRLSGKLLGFDMCTIVDDGQTLVSRAGRTRPDCQNRGISSQISDSVSEFLPPHLSRNLVRGCYTTSTLIPTYHRSIRTGTPLLLHRPYMVVQEHATGCVESLANARCVGEPNAKLKQLQEYEVTSLFGDRPPASCLTNERVIVTWVPFRRCFPGNVRLLYEMEDVVVLGEQRRQDDWHSISFGTSIPMPLMDDVDSVRFDLDIYTTDHRDVEKHIYYQFYRAALKYPRHQIYSVISFSDSSRKSREEVEAWCKSIGMHTRRGLGPFHDSNLALFEYEMKRFSKL